ncbi:MAG: hypothetical protein JRC53_01130 [Deltaproteobacteria bacterium]|nr:hypothetical protein [Deltaproteobacteria bacterium]
MKETLSTSQAANMLVQDENAGWSYNGATALIEYLEQMEEECGMEIEFDRVAIRCEYSEYKTAIECAENYDFESDEDDDEDDQEESALRYLHDNTSVIEFEGGIIIQDW